VEEKMEFYAKAVFVGEVEDEFLFMVALGEEDDGLGNYFMVQLADDFDEQDSELGMDTYCVVGPGQATYYGGVVAWDCSQGSLRVSLSPEAAQELGFPSELSICFPASETERVREGMQTVLRNL
jgi:hypothetical protein